MSDAPASSTLADAYAHCEAEAKAADRVAWLAALFAPADKRPAFHALAAFLQEIGTVRDKVREPLAGELRLQWWTDAFEGEARGDVRGHPVAAALIDAIRRHGLPRSALSEIVEAKRQDLYDEPLATLAEFNAWADRTEGAVFLLRAAVLSAPAEAIRVAATHAGRAAAVLKATQALARRHATRSEVRLPLDLLKAQGIGTAEVAVARDSPAIRAVLEQMRGHAETNMAALRRLRADIPEAAGPGFLTANIVPPLLRQLARRGYDPFSEPLGLPQWREQWILWRAAGRNGIR